MNEYVPKMTPMKRGLLPLEFEHLGRVENQVPKMTPMKRGLLLLGNVATSKCVGVPKMTPMKRGLLQKYGSIPTKE